MSEKKTDAGVKRGKSLRGLIDQGSEERKGIPLCTGLLDYFPAALAEVAKLSKAGNDKHNPGQPLHWSREKSSDHADCIMRHLVERGTTAPDGTRHSAALAWRALALLQLEMEAEGYEVARTPRGGRKIRFEPPADGHHFTAEERAFFKALGTSRHD
jgi:hypothetical protein